MKNSRSKNKNKNKKKELGGCDDCMICSAMKDGTANSYDGLMKAFDEQNIKNSRMSMRVQNRDDLCYDAMEVLNIDDYKSAEMMLLKAKDIDPDYVQTYVGLVSVYSRKKDLKKREECIINGFDKTKKMFPVWPKRLEWGLMEHRAPLRAIQYMADLFWDNSDYKKAEELFRLLLDLNPNDNQGVRYDISAMFAGITGESLNQMFDEGNGGQNWDKLERLVDIQNKKYKFWRKPKDY